MYEQGGESDHTDFAYARDLIVVRGIDDALRSTEFRVRFKLSRFQRTARLFADSWRSIATAFTAQPQPEENEEARTPADVFLSISVNGADVSMPMLCLDDLGRLCLISATTGKYLNELTDELLQLFGFKSGHNKVKYYCHFKVSTPVCRSTWSQFPNLWTRAHTRTGERYNFGCRVRRLSLEVQSKTCDLRHRRHDH
jgi:hypothetical protein